MFRQEEFVAWKTQQANIRDASIRNILHYHCKTGRIVNVRRGLYAVVPPDASAANHSIDAYLLAGRIAEDSVLAYHTALEIYGQAYSVFNQTFFITTKKIKPFSLAGQSFHAVLQSPEQLGKEVVTINRQGLDLRITSLERTFVDVIDRIELNGGWEEVSRAVNNMATLKVEKAITYCLSLDNRILAAKVGYFLEQRTGGFAVPESMLARLHLKKPQTTQSIMPKRAQYEKGKLIKNWNIIIPASVYKKSWEEPDYDV